MAERRTRARWVGLILASTIAVWASASLGASGPLGASGSEIAYDDGTAEVGRGQALAGAGFAVRFTLPAGGAILESVRIFVTGLRGNPAPVEVRVWSGDRTPVGAAVEVTPAGEGWLEADFSPQALTLSGDVFVGFLQTSGEDHPWLGLDLSTTTARSVSLPDWSSLLPEGASAMIRIVTGDGASAGSVELAYDDGTAEAGRGYAFAGAGYAVRFEAPAGGGTLLRARLYVEGFHGVPAPLEMHIWDADGNDLVEPFDVLPAVGGWFDVDLTPLSLRVEGDFAVGYLQMDGDNYPWLGIDTGELRDRSYSVPDWNLLLPSGANAMIRVVLAPS